MATLEIYDAGSTNLYSPVSKSNPLPIGQVTVLPTGAIAVTASSGNQANTAAIAILPGVAGKTTYLTGYSFTGGGATAAALVSPTIAGLLGGTATFTYGVVAGVTSANAPLAAVVNHPMPASAANTAIVATLPALGLGNTNATVVLHGFQL